MSIDPVSTVQVEDPGRISGTGRRGLLNSVVEEIGLRVLSGAYQVGQSIATEPVLASELRVSRTVLREALKILIAKGLLETRPKTGTRVLNKQNWNLLDPTILRLYCRVTNYSNFAEHFQQLRFIIEPEAAALAAANHDAEQLRTVTSAYEAMASAEDVRAWTRADLEFHMAILEATGNPFVLPLGALIHTALETLLYQSASNSPDPFESIHAHLLVLNAIRKRNANGARSAMKDLLGHTSLAMAQVIEDSKSLRRGKRPRKK